MERFRARLLELQSLNDIRQVVRDLHALELNEPVNLPFFTVAWVLEEVHQRLSDRPLEVATWNQVRNGLQGPMTAVVDAHRAGDLSALFGALNALTRRWATIREELA